MMRYEIAVLISAGVRLGSLLHVVWCVIEVFI